MSSEYTERCLVRVDSETHKGEWLRMVSCPIPHCDAVWGEDYERFAAHLAAEHGPEDVGLSSDERRVATDGGTERGKCAYCRGKIVAAEPRKTEDGFCCYLCWQSVELGTDQSTSQSENSTRNEGVDRP